MLYNKREIRRRWKEIHVKRAFKRFHQRLFLGSNGYLFRTCFLEHLSDKYRETPRCYVFSSVTDPPPLRQPTISLSQLYESQGAGIRLWISRRRY